MSIFLENKILVTALLLLFTIFIGLYVAIIKDESIHVSSNEIIEHIISEEIVNSEHVEANLLAGKKNKIENYTNVVQIKQDKHINKYDKTNSDSDGRYKEISLSMKPQEKYEYFEEIDQKTLIEKAIAEGFATDNAGFSVNTPSLNNINRISKDDSFKEIDQNVLYENGVTDGSIIPEIEFVIEPVTQKNILGNKNDIVDPEINQQTIIENAKLQGLI